MDLFPHFFNSVSKDVKLKIVGQRIFYVKNYNIQLPIVKLSDIKYTDTVENLNVEFKNSLSKIKAIERSLKSFNNEIMYINMLHEELHKILKIQLEIAKYRYYYE